MKVLFRLLKFIQPFWKEILLAILAGITTICAGIGLLSTSAFLIASAALQPSIAELQVAIVGVRFFGISRAVFRYLERILSHSVNLRILSNLRGWLYSQVESSTHADLNKYKSGDLLDRLLGDLETLENFYVRVISPVIIAVVVCIGASIFIGQYAIELGVILASGLLINGVVLPIESVLISKKTMRLHTETRSALSAQMLEYFQGLADIQTSGSQQSILQNIDIHSRKAGHLQVRVSWLSGINAGASLFILNITVVILLCTVIPLVEVGSLTGIDLAVILSMGMASFEATNPLPQAAQNMNSSVESAKRIFKIADTSREAQTYPDLKGQGNPSVIRFEEVSLDYEAGTDFGVKEIGLILSNDKKIALIGPSGAGKTSLVNLLLRFHEPASGKICFDEQDSREIDPEVCRGYFGVLSQNVYLFDDTLRNNLLMANQDASDQRLLQVISQCRLDDWFMNLPNGLDTEMGERGQRLSGGEQQRVAIARVLLQDRPYLLLDEPLAHLDQAAAEDVFIQIFELFSDRGMLFITHDLRHLDRFDEIILIENGLIVDRGRYDQVSTGKGRLHSLLEKQSMLFD